MTPGIHPQDIINATVAPRINPDVIFSAMSTLNREYITMPEYIIGLPAFLAWFACGLIALGLFGFIYTRITPHDEMSLMRAGNTSAAVAFVGVLIGYSLPLGSAAANTVTLGEFIVWALVGFVVQVLAYFVANMLQPGLSKRIVANDMAAAVWKGGFAIAVGMINANCMTY